MHIDLQRQNQLLQAEIKLLREQQEGHHAETMNQLPSLVAEKVLSQVHVEGAQQMTVDQMTALMRSLLAEHSAANTAAVTAASVTTASALTPAVPPGTYAFFSWGGRLRPVPEEWSFPKGSVKTLCDLFVMGIPAIKVRPFRKILGRDLRRSDQGKFYKAEYVFNHIVGTAVTLKLITSAAGMSTVTLAQWDTMFSAAFAHELSLFASPVTKPGDISVITYYDKLLLHHKQVATPAEAAEVPAEVNPTA